MKHFGRLIKLSLLALLIVGIARVLPTPWRRVADLAEDYEVELAAERSKPALFRPVLRGRPAAEEELGSAIAHVLGSIAPISTSDFWLWCRTLRPPQAVVRSHPTDLERYRIALAPTVAAIRSALQAETIERRPGVDPFRGIPWERHQLVGSGFRLQMWHALDAGDVHEAAELTTDMWRFLHDYERLVVGNPSRFEEPGLLAVEVIERLDEPGLRALESELARLEEAAPRYADAIRRERLRGGADLGAYLRGEDPLFLEPGDRSLQCALFLKRYWVIPDREARWLEHVLASEPTWVAWDSARHKPSFQGSFDLWLDQLLGRIAHPGSISWALAPDPFVARLNDLSYLRAARILAAARSWSLSHGGAAPPTLADALGHEPGEHELDPYDGKPMRFRITDTEVLAYSVGRNLVDEGGRLAPTDLDGPPDVGLALRR